MTADRNQEEQIKYRWNIKCTDRLTSSVTVVQRNRSSVKIEQLRLEMASFMSEKSVPTASSQWPPVNFKIDFFTLLI